MPADLEPCIGSYNLGMSEREPNRGEPDNPDHYRQTFTEFLAGEKADSAKYQAFADFYQSRQLRWTRFGELDRLGEDLQPAARLAHESELRITELEIALHNREIDRKRASLPGYNQAFNIISEMVADLAEASREEIKPAYPETPEQQLVKLSQSRINRVLDGTYIELVGRINP